MLAFETNVLGGRQEGRKEGTERARKGGIIKKEKERGG